MRYTRSLITMGAALAAMTLLAACQQSSEAPKTETAAAPAEPAPAAAPAPAPAPAAAAAPAAASVQLAVADASGTTLSGDPAAGAKVFRQCQTCHAVVPGKNLVGPSLAGIIGKPAGTVPGFRYSNANKNSGITWSEQELYTYLEDPKKRIPGTIMAFVGLKDSKQRADVIAYLKGLSA